mgnify:CR=1 FL=1
MIELNDNNYKTFTGSNLVLVDLKAEWCKPCQVLSPIVDELSVEYQGRLVVGKLDVDNNPETTKELGVRNIPTILIYKDGQIVDRSVGMASKIQLKALIDKHIISE